MRTAHREPDYNRDRAEHLRDNLFSAPVNLNPSSPDGKTPHRDLTAVAASTLERSSRDRVPGLARDIGEALQHSESYQTFLRTQYEKIAAEANARGRITPQLQDPESNPPNSRLISEETFVARFGLASTAALYENSGRFRQIVNHVRSDARYVPTQKAKLIATLIDQAFNVARSQQLDNPSPIITVEPNQTQRIDELAAQATLLDTTALLIAHTFSRTKRGIERNAEICRQTAVTSGRNGKFNPLSGIQQAMSEGKLKKLKDPVKRHRSFRHARMVPSEVRLEKARTEVLSENARIAREHANRPTDGKLRRAGNFLTRGLKKTLNTAPNLWIEVRSPVAAFVNDSLLGVARLYTMHQVAKLGRDLTNLLTDTDRVSWLDRNVMIRTVNGVAFSAVQGELRRAVDGWRTGESKTWTSLATLVITGYAAQRATAELRDNYGKTSLFRHYLGIGRGRWRIANTSTSIGQGKVDEQQARLAFLQALASKTDSIADAMDKLDDNTTVAGVIIEQLSRLVNPSDRKPDSWLSKRVNGMVRLIDEKLEQAASMPAKASALAEIIEIPMRILQVFARQSASSVVGDKLGEGLVIERLLKAVEDYTNQQAQVELRNNYARKIEDMFDAARAEDTPVPVAPPAVATNRPTAAAHNPVTPLETQTIPEAFVLHVRELLRTHSAARVKEILRKLGGGLDIDEILSRVQAVG